MAVKNSFNMKVILIVGVVIAAVVIAAAMFLTSSFDIGGIGSVTHGERLSGKYVCRDSIPAIGGNYAVDENIYIEFSGANKFTLYGSNKPDGSAYLAYQGTYTVERTNLTFEWTWGDLNCRSYYVSINDDRDTITIGGGMSSSGLVAFDGLVFKKV
jgi:hypothetical protein